MRFLRHHWFWLIVGCTLAVLNGNASWGADGLQVTIEKVVINDQLQPEVTFTLKDDAGAPLALSEISAPRFIVAYLNPIEAGTNRYVAYNFRTQTVPEGYPNAGAASAQATYDSGGKSVELDPGRYLYTFGTALPANYDQSKVHTVSAQIERTVGEKRFVANPLYHWIPNGDTNIDTRQVVTTETCNQCHTSLGLHGGGRKEVGLCIVCHSPDTNAEGLDNLDPDTGNTIDMTTMIHKIHMGANLPSVQAGGQYLIVGHNQSSHDYSHVNLPMDVRNCTVCHTGGEDSEQYKTAPSRMACGSCHDDVNFTTGAGHGPGIPQLNDSMCKNCHQPDGHEFDISVTGAHTIPAKSQNLKELTLEIVEVQNAAPGQAPTLVFSVKEDGAALQDLTGISIGATYAGPTSDYQTYIREAIAQPVKQGDNYVYTFKQPLPATAATTWAFSMEARRTVTVAETPPDEDDITTRQGAWNPIRYVSVDSSPVIERRTVVSQDKCNACHDKLEFHGNQRFDLQYCVMCHNPNTPDIGVRPEGVGGGESVQFAYMIHKIHSGANLENGYLVYGYGSSVHDYSHIGFSGRLVNCQICHEDEPTLPLAETAQPIDFVNKDGQRVIIPPTTASCTSCHDMRSSVAHANLNTTEMGVETCAICHKEGRSADIHAAHQLNEFLNVTETLGPPPTSVELWKLLQQ